jgi:tetratricopeptide (TPR) repeat protein
VARRYRPSGARLFFPTFLLFCLASPLRAQTVEQYLTLAREYASGRGEEATDRLAAWSTDDVTNAAVAAASAASVRDLIALAVLHTDAANVIIDTRPELARFHINKARGALTVASERIGAREHLEPVIRRWFRFVASVYTSAELIDEASSHLLLAERRFPGDAGLCVAHGVLLEVIARKRLVTDWRRDATAPNSNRSRIEGALQDASSQFMRAIAIDPHNAEAHLHLGWIRFVLADGRATTELEAAVADADNDTTRYLAHLFLGGVAERNNRLEDALREYTRARDAGAEFQTPYVAMSRIEQALGHTSVANELALQALGLDKSDNDDPWWDHRIGFDRASLEWLRAEVRKP